MAVTITEFTTPVTVTVDEDTQDVTITVSDGVPGPAGPAGAAGPNSVTSATSSDGTANLSISDLQTATATVTGTLTANHIHGNIAGSLYAHVRAGENLAKGDPVYISGSHGSGSTLIAIVSKARADNAAKMPAVGIMDAAVSANASGHMVISGTISDLNTNAYAVNGLLYVGETGGLSSTGYASNLQPVARVERVNTNNGAILVEINPRVADIGAATAAQGAIVDAATNAATPNTLVLRGPYGEAAFGDSGNGYGGEGIIGNSYAGIGVYGSSTESLGVYGSSNVGDGIYGYSVSGNGAYAKSETATGCNFISGSGTNHAQFGETGNNRSFIRRVLGLFGWHRGSYVQTLGSKSTLSADSAIELPDVASGTLMVGSNNLSDLTNTSTARTNLGAGTTGDALFTAAAVAGAWAQLGRKEIVLASTTSDVTSDTTYSSRSTFASFPVSANTSYRCDVFLLCTAGAGGIKARLTFPSLIADTVTNSQKLGVRTYWNESFGTVISGDSTNNQAILIADSDSTTNGQYVATLFFRIGSTGGNMVFEWAQNASNAAATKLLAGSTISLDVKATTP